MNPGRDGLPIRVMLFSSQSCNPGVRPTKIETKTAVKLLPTAALIPTARRERQHAPEAASHGCDRELTRMLIKAGAKVDAKNKMGLTPSMGFFYGHDGLEELIAADTGCRPTRRRCMRRAAGVPVQALIVKATKK
jgi:hypothetical protein